MSPQLSDRSFAALMGLILLIALFARYAAIDQPVLDQFESQIALRSMALANGERVVRLGEGAPFYEVWTAGLFSLFITDHFWARFLPALAGAALVLTPLFFRSSLEKWSVLFFSLLLALDPGFVSVSRVVSGTIFSVLFLIMAVGFGRQKKSIASGIFSAFALLSGPSIWLGLLALAGAFFWAFYRQLRNDETRGIYFAPGVLDWKTFGIAFALSYLLAGSMFFLVPAGLSGAFQSMAAFWSGWGASANRSVIEIVMGLVGYELFPLFVGVIGIAVILLKQSADSLSRFLLRFAILAMALILVYPQRQMSDLLWVIFPLLFFAARQMGVWLDYLRHLDWIELAAAMFIFAILVFLVMNLIAIINTSLPQEQYNLRFILGIGTVFLIALVMVMLAYGWGLARSLASFVLAVGVVLLFGWLSAAWNGAGLGNYPERELWREGTVIPRSAMIEQTVEDLSEWSRGTRETIDIVMVGMDEPALRWLLRGFAPEQVSSLPASAAPSIIISPEGVNEQWGTAYSGQTIVVGEQPDWKALGFRDWLLWSLLRKVEVEQHLVILWARSDAFPGGNEIIIEN
ncbi:MAG: hypothetical protein JW750_04940 [Anaerolineaceae bacterium]|nr:hypothetical protein [Anaerolineaceae bacterium]